MKKPWSDARRLVVAVVMLVTEPIAGAQEWEKLAPLPQPNGGFVCGAIGDRIVRHHLGGRHEALA
jgi:hypothetical protein